jgi:hypothetical protein
MYGIFDEKRATPHLIDPSQMTGSDGRPTPVPERSIIVPHLPMSPIPRPTTATPRLNQTLSRSNNTNRQLLKAIEGRMAELENSQISSVASPNPPKKLRAGRGGICQCAPCRKAKRGKRVNFTINLSLTNLQDPCRRDSDEEPCYPCRRRGFSLEQCGPSTFGPEAEKRHARNRGEHTMDKQNDVRTNASSSGGTNFPEPPNNPVGLAPPEDTLYMETTRQFDPTLWITAIRNLPPPVDPDFEAALGQFVSQYLSLSNFETVAQASDLMRMARGEHNGTRLFRNEI